MIVVFGAINIDLVIAAPNLPAPGETVIGETYRLAPGGKGANQALAAARDGARVLLAGAIGKDGFAEPALALLRAAGVELALAASAERPTGCAAITVAAERREHDHRGRRRQSAGARRDGGRGAARAREPPCCCSSKCRRRRWLCSPGAPSAAAAASCSTSLRPWRLRQRR